MDGNLATTVDDFLAHKRALVRKYLTEEAVLRLLVAFAKQNSVTSLLGLTPHLLDDFVASRPRPRDRSFNHLVGVMNGFLDWAVSQQRLEVLPWHGTRRRVTDQRLPFLFDPSQVRRLLEAAAALPDNPRAFNRGPTYHAIFALCYGLGLRAGEACALHLNDIDADRQLLVVRGGKFGKSRLVPFGPRIGRMLTVQLARRTDQEGAGQDAPLFTFDGRRCVHPSTASQTFHRIVTEMGFPVPQGTTAPHLHSLRHSFAVGRLLRWYREGVEPSGRLLQLATFMGHVDPSSTAVYLTITPELLSEANSRFEAYAMPSSAKVTP